MPRQSKGREVRQRLDPNWWFTVDWLRDNLGLNPMQSDDALTTLAIILNSLRNWFLELEQTRDYNALVKRAEGALQELRDTLPDIEAKVRNRAEAGDPFMRVPAKSLSKLLTAVEAEVKLPLDQLAIPQPRLVPQRGEPADWHALNQEADWRALLNNDALPVAIRKAAGRSLGVSRAGPLVQAIAALLPHMTGERRTPTAVYNQLRQNAPRDGGK